MFFKILISLLLHHRYKSLLYKYNCASYIIQPAITWSNSNGKWPFEGLKSMLHPVKFPMAIVELISCQHDIDYHKN